jgi:hypothetical protein
MTLTIEYIKKLMGWCPNTQANRTERNIHLEDNYLNTLDTARGKIGNQNDLGWFQKASIRTLFACNVLTLMYVLLFSQLGINLILFLAGFFIALFFVIFHWKARMQLYAGLVKQPYIDHSNMEKLYAIIVFVLYLGIFFLYTTGREPSLQSMFSLFGGFLTYFWLGYIQILYWEKKNHKRIYFDKSYGTWKKSYIILEKDEH